MYFKLIPLLIVASALSGGVLCSKLRIQLREEGYERMCTREGIMCKDCNTLVSCRKSGDGFVEDTTIFCPEYAPCDEITLSCSPKGTCRYQEFQCPHSDCEGDCPEVEFPDPYSCVQFHGCLMGTEYHYECPEGQSFDMKNGNCSGTLKDKGCETYPIDPCAVATDTATDIKGTSYTVKCVKIDGAYGNSIIYPQLDIKSTTASTATTTTTTTVASTTTVAHQLE